MTVKERGFTDIHSHLIYGVDDGARDADMMYRMLDMYASDGVHRVYATSHRAPGKRSFPEELYERHLQEARGYCERRGYPLRVYRGAELMVTPLMGAVLGGRGLRTMGNTDIVLLEFHPAISMREAERSIAAVADAGYRPILAHIERYRFMDIRSAAVLKQRYGLRLQINCEAVLDGCGLLRDLTVRHWLRDGLIDMVASDAHDTLRRPARMWAAYQALERRYGQRMAERLTHPVLTNSR